MSKIIEEMVNEALEEGRKEGAVNIAKMKVSESYIKWAFQKWKLLELG